MTDPDLAPRTVLGALLQAHPRMLGLDELPDVAELVEVVERLADDGLVTRLGDLVGATRAATRFAALGPV